MRSAAERGSEGAAVGRGVSTSDAGAGASRLAAAEVEAWTVRYDADLGRKRAARTRVDDASFVASAVAGLGGPGGRGGRAVVCLCSGVPSLDPSGRTRAEVAAAALVAAGAVDEAAFVAGGHPAWGARFTLKLEERVVGFGVASGGTSVEQRLGGGSNAALKGADADALVEQALAPYRVGGVYAP